MPALSLLIGDDLPVHIPKPVSQSMTQPSRPGAGRPFAGRAKCDPPPKLLSRQAAVPRVAARPYEAARHRAEGRQFHLRMAARSTATMHHLSCGGAPDNI